MLLQTVRPNIVQSIRAYRVDDLMKAARQADQHFLYANLTSAQSKQDVLDGIAESFTFPAHFGKNLDALFDCMTDLVHKAGPQTGFVVVTAPERPSLAEAGHFVTRLTEADMNVVGVVVNRWRQTPPVSVGPDVAARAPSRERFRSA